MQNRLVCLCLAVAVMLLSGFGACGGGGNNIDTSTSDAPALAKVRIWLTLSDNPDDTPVATLTPEQTIQASIWVKGMTQDNLTIKINLDYKGNFSTLATGVKTEGSSKAVMVGGFANPLESGDYTFQAITGVTGNVIGSLDFTVVSPAITTLPTINTTPTAIPTSTLSEQPDLVTFHKYFTDLGLGKLPAGGQLPIDLEQNVTVFSKGDLFCLYGTVIQEVQITASYYNVITEQTTGAGSPPGKMGLGGFAGSSPLDLTAGKYEYKVYADGVLIAVMPFEVLAATLPVTPEQPDKAAFNTYFRDMGLGRLPAGGKVEQDLTLNVKEFIAGEQMVLWGNIIKDCPPPRYTIYGVQNDKTAKAGGLTFPTIPPGYDATGFIFIETIELPVGKYEYRVFVDDVFVAVFTFEVK